MDFLPHLVELANEHQVARITYQKAAEVPHAREVEPYRIDRGRYEILLYCFQRSPEEGWRQFKPSKIRSVEPTGASFTPRRKIAFDAGVLGTVWHPETSPTFEFSDLISTFITDLEISDAESAELRRFRAEAGLSQADVDQVCADLYRCAEQHTLADGVIDATEAEYLRRYKACLLRAGWASAEAPTSQPRHEGLLFRFARWAIRRD